MNINKTIKYQAIFIYLKFNRMKQIYFSLYKHILYKVCSRLSME